MWLHNSGILAAPPDSIIVHAPAVLAHDTECSGMSTLYLRVIKYPYVHQHCTVLDAAINADFFIGNYNIKIYLLINKSCIVNN